MLDQNAKNLFVSVLEHNINCIVQGKTIYGKGTIESLADVLEKTKAGILDWNFDDDANSDNADYDEYYKVWEDEKRWEAMAKEQDKYYKKLFQYMTQDDYALYRDNYLASTKYVSDRRSGYQIAYDIMEVICRP